MNKRNSKHQPQITLKPSVVGAGLVTLDVVVNLSTDDEVQYFAGGTHAGATEFFSFQDRPDNRFVVLFCDLPGAQESLHHFANDPLFVDCQEFCADCVSADELAKLHSAILSMSR